VSSQVFIAHPGLTRTDHFGKADTDAKWSSAGVERFANSFWGTDANMGAIPLMFASTEPNLKGELRCSLMSGVESAWCHYIFMCMVVGTAASAWLCVICLLLHLHPCMAACSTSNIRGFIVLRW
jgi:hypothetical protein